MPRPSPSAPAWRGLPGAHSPRSATSGPRSARTTSSTRSWWSSRAALESSPARSSPRRGSAASRRPSSRRSARSSARSRFSWPSSCSSSGGRRGCSRRGAGMPKREAIAVGLAAFLLVVVLPLCNTLRADAPFSISNFTLNLFGKFLAYAILALGLDLLWGYAGVLSLGHGVFFGLGAYAMGMHLMLEIGAQGVYQSALPDFMVWNRVTALPLFWRPFYSAPFTVLAVLLVPALFALAFGYLVFRSRIRGVYFSIITQALALCAWLVFNRNEMNLGGTNGLADFKTIFGFRLNQPSTQRGLYVVTAAALLAAYVLCRWITRSRAGKVLVAIRDSETRVLFSGYSPANYKLFVFVVSAILAGVAGALYVPQVGIITPAKIGVLPS